MSSDSAAGLMTGKGGHSEARGSSALVCANMRPASTAADVTRREEGLACATDDQDAALPPLIGGYLRGSAGGLGRFLLAIPTPFGMRVSYDA